MSPIQDSGAAARSVHAFGAVSTAKNLESRVTPDLWAMAEAIRRALPASIRLERARTLAELIDELDHGGVDCLPALKMLRAAGAKYYLANLFSVMKSTAGAKRVSPGSPWRALAEKSEK
jgi:hypothetical protein